VIAVVRTEVSILSEMPQAAELFLEGTPSLEGEAKTFLADPLSQKVIDTLISELDSKAGEFLPDEVETLPKKIGALTGVKGKALFMPIRAAITGKTHGPELKLILPLLGRETALKRIHELRKQAVL
jgi:nondiscriminating glutamyl-tRNA synthetase